MMQDWFKQAKLGIFIHWGIYAVKGVGESWSFYHGSISYEDYMAQCEGFTAQELRSRRHGLSFKRAGARYAVLTTKHHDGVALWDTKQNDLSVVKKTPAGRDLIAPYVEALRKHDLKVGLYYSLIWTGLILITLPFTDPMSEKRRTFCRKTALPTHLAPKILKLERFLQFHRAQLEELLTNLAQ